MLATAPPSQVHGIVNKNGTILLVSKRLQSASELLAFLTVIAAMLGMFLSTPRMASPDEPAHQSTAWYVTNTGMPPTEEIYAPVPGNVNGSICYAFDAANDASCLGPRQPLGASEGRIFNYPPVYYWTVGFGQWVATSAGDQWMDLGGRASSLVLNLLGLTVLALLTRHQSRIWGSSLLLVSTPMVVFLWAVVNSSGWQITTGLLFAYAFAQVWWGTHRDLDLKNRHWTALTAVAVASILFALSRPDSLIWLLLLILAVTLMGRSAHSLRLRAQALAAAGLGVLAGVVWQLMYPSQHPIENPNPLADPGITDYLRWFQQSLDLLPDRLHQSVGVMGWLDTPTPRWLFIATLIAWAAFLGFLYARNRIPTPVVVLGIVSVFILPSILEATRWNDYPQFWQGRYTLTFLVPFVFLILTRYAGVIPQSVERFSLLATATMAIMVWQNGVRYAFGVRDYWPIDWVDPAIGPWPFAITMASATTIAFFGLTRLVLFSTRKRPLPTQRS